LLDHANGVVGAIGILAIDKAVVVIVEAIVANFWLGHAIRREMTRRIGAIDLVVAIVVFTVVANLGRAVLTRGRNEARRIGTINEFVAVLVQSARTYFRFARRHANAREYAITIGIRTIDEQIAIVVLMIPTRFGGRLARAMLGGNTIGFVAIDRTVAIVVEAIVTTGRFVRQTSTRRRTLTIGIETIDDRVAIVVEAIGTSFPTGRRRTSAIHSLLTG
jgi:hypothetical protein